MHPMYDLAKMICSLILIIMMFRLTLDLGESYVQYFIRGNSRIVQEFVSGFISMSNYAPSQFYVNNTFPEVSHLMQVLENPPLVNISSGKVARRPLIKFREYPPLSYTKTEKIKIQGNCTQKFCEFSGEKLNSIILSKNEDILEINVKQK